MIKNRFLLYLLCGVMVSPAAALGECKPTQDCRALGYKEAPCPEQGVKCPFGETWYCPLRCKDGEVWENGKCQAKGGELGQCTGYAKNCKIGDILNSDGTCTANKESGKTPVGIVVYIGSDNCGQAIALQDLGKIKWSSEEVDIPNLSNYTSVSAAEKDFDSCGNTQKIIKYGNASLYPAAWAANNYAPTTVPETKGKWCLPAAGVARSIMNNFSAIDTGLSKTSNETYLTLTNESWRLTSSEVKASGIWRWSERVMDVTLKSWNFAVRPVIEF